jgi:putative transposase
LSTATWRYRRRGRVDNAALVAREGVVANHKRVYVVYRAAALQVRRRKRKRVTGADRQPLAAPQRRNTRWSMDFMADTLADGRGFRTLNIVDDFSRECPGIEVDRSLPGACVVRVLERLRETHGLPKAIVVDNGRRPGPTSTRSRSASFAQASRSRTRTSRASTESFATSV